MMGGIDIRFLLIALGLLLASLAMAPWAVFDAFQAAVGNGGIIGPICSAMGYAYVLKATGSDREMVMLLTRPLRTMRWLLVPGGVVIGFITNMAITSQTASAAALGPVLIPIMRSAGYSPLAAAVTLLVGCSVGGNLFNPGEPDIVTIKDVTAVLSGEVISAAVVPNLVAAAAATLILMLMLRPTSESHGPTADDLPEPSLAKALLPPLPVFALLLLQPGLNLIPPIFTIYPNGLHVSMVMLLSTVVAMAVHAADDRRGTPSRWQRLKEHLTTLTTEFFDGMGYAFAHVISIIIAASCFIAGLTALGVIDAASMLLASNADLARVASPLLTAGMAVMSGSGTAPSVAFSKAMLPGLLSMGPGQAIDIGVLGAIGANVGRTMSPVAAVVLFTSALAQVSITDLVKYSARAMLAALAAVILYGLLL